MSRKTTLLYYGISALCGSLFTILIAVSIKSGRANNTVGETENIQSTESGAYKVKRYSSNYKYINPIISVESVNESANYAVLKEAINNYIAVERENGLTYASVYFKELTDNEWFSINARERYDPASLLKVGVLITYLRMAELHKELLDMEVVYQGRPGFVFPTEHFGSDTVVEGRKYKISELLQHMIRYSDNRATLFLEDHMDTTIFKKEFTDLGLPEPHFNGPSFTLDVEEYAMMFKALYNAGYLWKTTSEDALALLTESVFKNGLLKELPAGVVAAHKYGECGNRISHELHEAGIIYLNDHPYLVTVMTRGTDWNKLSEVVGHISKMVYDSRVNSLTPKS